MPIVIVDLGLHMMKIVDPTRFAQPSSHSKTAVTQNANEEDVILTMMLPAELPPQVVRALLGFSVCITNVFFAHDRVRVSACVHGMTRQSNPAKKKTQSKESLRTPSICNLSKW